MLNQGEVIFQKMNRREQVFCSECGEPIKLTEQGWAHKWGYPHSHRAEPKPKIVSSLAEAF